MSGTSGYSEKEYAKRKKAHDELRQKLIDHGVRPDKAHEKANQIARETDNKRRSEGKE